MKLKIEVSAPGIERELGRIATAVERLEYVAGASTELVAGELKNLGADVDGVIREVGSVAMEVADFNRKLLEEVRSRG